MSGKITHGADVEQLDDIAVGLRRQGTRIADVGGRGAVQLERLRALWDGPDFEKFAKEWRAAHRFIDDAEAAMRTFSRTLVAEADQQRRSSGGSGNVLGGGSVPRPRSGFTREDVGMGLVGPRVEQLPGGLTRLTLEGPGGPVRLASPDGMLVTGGLPVALPGLPGAEEIGAVEPPSFERMDMQPPTSAPAQVPTGNGAFVTTAPDAAGQVSVAFDPRVLPEAGWADAGSGAGWLGLDDLDDPTPRRT